MISALRWEVGGQHHAPAALPPAKTRYPLYKRLGGPQGRSGRVRKISPRPGFDPRDRLARSESLYRLSYRGPLLKLRLTKLIRGDIIRLCWSVINKCSSHKHNISTLYVRFYFVLHVSAIRIEHHQVGEKNRHRRTDFHVALFHLITALLRMILNAF